MPKYWFDHAHLASKNPTATVEFYVKTFNAKKDIRKLADGRTLAAAIFDGASIKVSEPRAKPLGPDILPDGCGLEHFGLRTDNLEEAVAELKAIGLKCVREITAANPTTKVAFFLSPENVLFELLEVSG